MADHTKEPWLCDKRTVYALNKNGFNTFSTVVQDCNTSNSELEANARRIVACVNWCEGNSTEGMELAVKIGHPYSVERDSAIEQELELMTQLKTLQAELSAIVEQRDELLAALEEAKIVMQDIGSARYHYDIVCNAIANAKGGAA